MAGSSAHIAHEEMLQIPVSNFNGEICKLELGPYATVAEVKQHLWVKTGLPVMNQRLLLDGTLLVSALSLAECNIEDGASLTLVHVLSCMLTGCADGKARLWDMDTGECKLTLDAAGDDSSGFSQVTSVAVAPDGMWVLTGSMSGAVKLWSTETGKCTMTLIPPDPAFEGSARSVAFCLDNLSALVGSEEGNLQLWSLQTCECTKTLTEGPSSIKSLVVSHDGGFVLTGSGDQAKFWNVATGVCIRTFKGHISTVTSVALSPDGCLVATGSKDASAKIWSCESGECLKTLCQEPKAWGDFGPHEEDVLAVAFSPDSSLIVTGFAYHHECKLWNVRNGEQVLKLDGINDVEAAAFSPDGLTVMTGDSTHYARLWSVETGECVKRFAHPDEVMAVTFCSGTY